MDTSFRKHPGFANFYNTTWWIFLIKGTETDTVLEKLEELKDVIKVHKARETENDWLQEKQKALLERKYNHIYFSAFWVIIRNHQFPILKSIYTQHTLFTEQNANVPPSTLQKSVNVQFKEWKGGKRIEAYIFNLFYQVRNWDTVFDRTRNKNASFRSNK